MLKKNARVLFVPIKPMVYTNVATDPLLFFFGLVKADNSLGFYDLSIYN